MSKWLIMRCLAIGLLFATALTGCFPLPGLTGDATEPAWNGYLLTVACPCGVTFERWVKPEDATVDMLGELGRPAIEHGVGARLGSQ